MSTPTRTGIVVAGLLAGLAILVGSAAITPAVPAVDSTTAPTVGAAPKPAGPAAAPACEYWVAVRPLGRNSNPGTRRQPWATLEYASEHVPDNHCTVWFGEGVYSGGHRLNRRFETTTTFRSIVPYRAVFENSEFTVALSGARNITLEGFRFRHSSRRARGTVVFVDQSRDGFAEWITFRNNIFHDSYNDDLLKVRDGSRFVTIEGNVFYNQGPDEQHLDVNGVTDVVVRDNIFFNDYAGSSRAAYKTKHYIVIKDSSEDSDGLLGSERVLVQRNVFFNWQGRPTETFVQIGNDGKPYHEAKGVRVENNLVVGNSSHPTKAVFGVKGARDVVFANNTIAGHLPSSGYGFWVSITGDNPPNRNIYFYNNVWSDPTGTMDEFSDGDPSTTENLVLDNNLYWNGGKAIAPGEVVNPLVDDARHIVEDPLLSASRDSVVLPRWKGTAFASGNKSIRAEFVRLVELYGRTPANGPTAGKADPALAPPDDILGRPRGSAPDLGVYQAEATALGTPTVDPAPTGTPRARRADFDALRRVNFGDGEDS